MPVIAASIGTNSTDFEGWGRLVSGAENLLAGVQ